MVTYLIDENLPQSRIPTWQQASFVHQRAIEPAQHDFGIWRYAAEHGLTIITKDLDFAQLALTHTPPPRVILFRLGGIKLREMRDYIERNWSDISQMSADNKLVNVFPTYLQGLN